MNRLHCAFFILRRLVLSAALLFTGFGNVAADDDCDIEQQLVCKVLDSTYIETINQVYQTETIEYQPKLGCYLLCVPDELDADSIALLASNDPQVIYCHPNFQFDIPESVQGSQPFVDRPGSVDDFANQLAGQQLQLAAAQANPVGAPVKVGVLDVGVDLQHPLLQSVVSSGYDFIGLDSLSSDEPGGRAYGHGTFIAGLIHLVAPHAQIRAYRVLDTNGLGNGFAVAQAILQAVADSCRVINLSLVMADTHEMIDQAIETAKENDVVVVVAAGNDSSSVERFPAGSSQVLTVTSVDSHNVKSAFANFGNVDLCAPGQSVYAPFPDTAFASWEGTSFAAPFVSGQVALMIARKPSANWSELYSAIRNSAINIDSLNPGLSGQLGHGLMNPISSLALLNVECGDLNEVDELVDVADLLTLVDYLFLSGLAPANIAAANVDGDHQLDIADLTLLVDHLFVTNSPLNCGF